MKAIRVEKQGGPEVLRLLDIAPIEAPGPGQAVVPVVTAGVNFLDVGQQRGTYPHQVPFTLGVKGAGVVESVGRRRPERGRQPVEFLLSACRLSALQEHPSPVSGNCWDLLDAPALMPGREKHSSERWIPSPMGMRM